MSLSQVIEGYLTPILASRYLPAGSLTVILWDHLITLDREVRLVWRSRGRSNEKWILNSAYVFNRYGAEACLLFIAYVSSGIKAPSSALCRSYVTLMLFCGTVALEISQFVLLLRVHYLTDQRRVILYYLIAGFTIAVSISQTFAVLTMLDLRKNVAAISIAGLNSCAAFKKPPFFSGILAPMFAFDIFIILLTIYNALERPHRSNAELITSLYKDGARFFIGITTIHFVELMIFAFGSIDNFSLLLVCWAFDVTLLARLHFVMKEFEDVKYPKPSHGFSTMYDF